MAKNTGKIMHWIYLGCLVSVIVAALAASLIYMNNFQLHIRLKGDESFAIEYGEAYQEPGADVFLSGAYAFRKGIHLNDVEPTISGSVSSHKLGVYNLEYEAQFMIWNGQKERTVYVVDTQCPEIQLTPGGNLPLQPGEEFQEPGFLAVDNHDGDITDRVIRKEETGLITYAVTDSSGNPGYAQREIPDYDPIAPEIILEGEKQYIITVGTLFEEPGYRALDNVDGDLTETVEVEGIVDWLTPGLYDLRYSVTDSYCNETTVTRTVEVQSKPWPEVIWPNERTIYLTFDDGPGPYTMTLLDILDRYGVKATFFVCDSEYRNLMQEIVKRGHSIGIHSVSHDYNEIYASPENFFSDLHQMQQIIYDNTGVWTSLMRFPGGGSNLVSKNQCEGIMTTLTWAVRDAGFQYFDWNVDSDDAGNAKSAKTVKNNVIQGIQEAGIGMVLQHDIHPYSVDAVESIIMWGLEHGYTFRPVTDRTPGFHHDVVN